MPESGSAGRRLSAITLDHAVSSASNVLVTILAARLLGIADFGFFGIVFLVYVAAQGCVRALAGEPLLARSSDAEDRAGAALGLGILLGLGVGVVLGVVAVACAPFDRDLALGMGVLAAVSPLLVLQDLGRYLAFATHRPARALLLDVVWLVLAVAGIVLLLVLDLESLPWFVLAWAGSGALAGLLVPQQYRGTRITLGLGWLRETWGFSWRYLVSYSSTQSAVLGASVALAAIAGAKALGAVRGALLLLGPFVQFQAAVVSAGVAEVARMRAGSAAVHRHVRRSTTLTTVVAALNTAVILALPDSLGRLVLGATWSATEQLLLPAGVQMLFLSMISGPRSALLGLRLVRVTVRIDVATTVITFVLPVVGAVLNGAVGAFWCLALGQGLIALIWWAAYRTFGGRRHPRTTAPEEHTLPAAVTEVP